MKAVYFIFCFLFSIIASAQTTYYVSTSGNDTNNGTSISTAWKTIQKAATSAAAGSTINILKGTYNEHVTNLVTGLPNNYITFQNYQNDTVTLEGAGTSGWGMWLIYGAAYIKLKGIHFSYHDSTTAAWSPALIIGNKSQFVEIKQCTFTQLLNNNSTGIAVYGNDTTSAGLHDVTIDSCTFGSSNFKMNQGIGMAGNVYQCTISNNLFHHITSQAIALVGSDSTSRSVFDFVHDIHVLKNEIHDIYNQSPGNYRQGILISGARNCLIEKNKIHHCDVGINITAYSNFARTDGIIFRENLVYQNYQEGLAMGVYNYTNSTGRIHYCNIHHNTFYENNALNNGDEIVLFPFDSSTINNNIFYFNNSNQLVYAWFYGVGFQHNAMDYNLYCSPFINPSNLNFSWDGNGGNYSFGYYKLISNVDLHSYYADPSFVHPYDSVPDFHIYNNSLAKDSGDAAFTVLAGETDFYNQPRIFNNRVDIGAVENQNDYAPIVITTGISATMNEEQLMIYPNPANESIVISHKSLVNTIEVTNVVGQTMKVIITPLSTYDLRLNTYYYPSGIYFLKATDINGKESNGKFVKE